MTTTARLYSGAELALQNMHLTSVEESTVRSIVQKYARPHSCSKLLCWTIYRIVQAVKSLFGCSEWQTARKVIENRFLCIAVERGVVQQDPDSGLEVAIKVRCMRRVFPMLSTEMLGLAVLNQENAIDRGRAPDFISLMNDLQERFTSIRDSLKPVASHLDEIFAQCARESAERASAPAA